MDLTPEPVKRGTVVKLRAHAGKTAAQTGSGLSGLETYRKVVRSSFAATPDS